MRTLKNNFIIGLLSFLPIAGTIWILWVVVRLVDDLFFKFFPAIPRLEFYSFRLPGVGLLGFLILIIFFGIMTKTIFGKFLSKSFERVLTRLPILGAIYQTIQKISSMFLSSDVDESSFKKVLYVPFPHQNCRSLAFQTGDDGESDCVVFVPTAPNPTSGYVLIYKKSDVEQSNLSVEEALQKIVSCGVLSDKK